MRKKKLFANSTNDKATGHAAQLKKKKIPVEKWADLNVLNAHFSKAYRWLKST